MAKQAPAFLFSSFAIKCTYEREFVLTTCSKNGADSIYIAPLLFTAYVTARTHSQQLIHSVTNTLPTFTVLQIYSNWIDWRSYIGELPDTKHKCC